MNNNLSEYPYLIIGFCILIIIILLLDLGVFNKKTHIISNKESFIWSLIWISLAMIFSLFIYIFAGIEKFAQFQSAYWIEKMLSIDNIFVFILIFNFFNVPKECFHKILFYGIFSAIIMRGLFICVGIKIIQYTYINISIKIFNIHLKINYILTIFALFLIYAGIQSWGAIKKKCYSSNKKNFINSPGAQIISLLFPVTQYYDNNNFFTKKNGKKIGTLLLIVLGVIEFSDLIFAIDSIPAIFSIAPNDSMILYTSNIFAILGLRSLYFLLANFINKFHKLNYGLAIILIFIGIKMIIEPIYHIKSIYALIFIMIILVVSTIFSIKKNYHN